jgi:hypothetical protein
MESKRDDKVSTQEKASGIRDTEISARGSVAIRLQRLEAVRRLHFLFLSVFSGVEFTLTFLTFDCTFSFDKLVGF